MGTLSSESPRAILELPPTQESDVTDEKKNVIGGDVDAKAEVSEGKANKPGALVEDSSLAGLTSGGVAPKDPSGKVTEGEATDKHENPSSDG